MIQASRRSFIAGLGTLIVAPSIVRVSSLMPVKSFDPYYTRCLCDYNIGTDQMMIRVDRALFPLPIPRYAQSVQLHVAEKIFGKTTINSIRPVEGQQLTISAAISESHFHEPGGSARTHALRSIGLNV